MEIELKDVSVSYYQKRVLKNINYNFEKGKTYAFTGANGSGKSTLVKVLAGVLKPAVGDILYKQNSQVIEVSELPRYLSWVAPYINLYEEFDADELYKFHSKFKNPKLGLEQFLEQTNLKDHRKKRIKYYSSGMKQRLKLALALFFECEVLILDEPTVNLDSKYQQWYLEHLKKMIDEAEILIVIASNIPAEYALAHEVIDVENFKK